MAEDRFRRLIRDLRVGVLVQGPALEIRHSNPAAQALLGLTEDQLHGRTSFDPAWQIVQEDGSPYPAHERPAATVLATGKPCRNVVMGIDRPARRDRVWLLVDVEPELHPDGSVAEVVSTLIDLTERKRLEASLARAQKLESVGRLAGGVAHDFNNLLTGIMSYTALARDAIPAESPARRDLDETLMAAERAAALTRQLLTFASQQPTTPRLVHPGEALASIHRLLSRLIGEHIELTTRVTPDCGHVRVDPTQLEQVLINLAVNARDAMPTGGRLSFTARNADPGAVDTQRPDLHARLAAAEHVVIQVQDTGTGMDAHTRDHLFEPFFTTKDVGRGTGLGLAIVHGVMEQHRGTIDVDSTLGRGTRFSLYLPRAHAVARPTGAARPVGLPGGTERLLVVEDDETVRRLAERILARLGYTVYAAADGEQAVTLASTLDGPLDLLVTDVVMPVMDGRTLARALRKTMPAMRVLTVSGYPTGLPDATEPFLSKPFTPGALALKVREVLDGPR